jgi:chemotaxis signal transduction protein
MFIVINWKNVDLCLFVDAIFQKHTVLKEDIKAPALAAKNTTSAFVSGLFQVDHKIVTLVNWDAYLSHGNIIIKDSDI